MKVPCNGPCGIDEKCEYLNVTITTKVNPDCPYNGMKLYPAKKVEAMLRTLAIKYINSLGGIFQSPAFDRAESELIKYAMSHPTEAGESQEGKE